MSLNGILSHIDISASGLRAERLRMEVLANNVANAHTTRTAEGTPYRRQLIIFHTAAPRAQTPLEATAANLRGVEVTGIVSDQSPLRVVNDPAHPDADEHGDVHYPNVSLPREMVDLMTATRAYEANLKVLQSFRSMAEQALALLRGTGS